MRCPSTNGPKPQPDPGVCRMFFTVRLHRTPPPTRTGLRRGVAHSGATRLARLCGRSSPARSDRIEFGDGIRQPPLERGSQSCREIRHSPPHCSSRWCRRCLDATRSGLGFPDTSLRRPSRYQHLTCTINISSEWRDSNPRERLCRPVPYPLSHTRVDDHATRAKAPKRLRSPGFRRPRGRFPARGRPLFVHQERRGAVQTRTLAVGEGAVSGERRRPGRTRRPSAPPAPRTDRTSSGPRWRHHAR